MHKRGFDINYPWYSYGRSRVPAGFQERRCLSGGDRGVSDVSSSSPKDTGSDVTFVDNLVRLWSVRRYCRPIISGQSSYPSVYDFQDADWRFHDKWTNHKKWTKHRAPVARLPDSEGRFQQVSEMKG